MWRAGENQVTTLTTEGDITIGGKKVPAGKYSLYVHAPADRRLVARHQHATRASPLGKIYSAASDKMKNEPWPRLDGYEKHRRQGGGAGPHEERQDGRRRRAASRST